AHFEHTAVLNRGENPGNRIAWRVIAERAQAGARVETRCAGNVGSDRESPCNGDCGQKPKQEENRDEHDHAFHCTKCSSAYPQSIRSNYTAIGFCDRGGFHMISRREAMGAMLYPTRS